VGRAAAWLLLALALVLAAVAPVAAVAAVAAVAPAAPAPGATIEPGPTTPAPPQGPADPLLRARILARTGSTSGALDLLTPLFNDPQSAEEARLIALETAAAGGRTDVVQPLAREVAAGAAPRLVAAAAEALVALGDEAAARALLTDGLAEHRSANPQATAPIQVGIGQLAEARGERAEARAAYDQVPPPPSAPAPRAAASGTAPGTPGPAAPPDSTARPAPIRPTTEVVVAADHLTAAAWGLRGRGEFQAAKDTFERALRADPGNVPARLGLATLLLEKHETRLARITIGTLLGSNPQHPTARRLLAQTYFSDGNYREAEAACQAVLDFIPDHPGVLELMAMLDLADEDLDGARTRIDRALAAAPGSRSIRSLNAASLTLAGDRAAAERETAAILAQAPHYADVHYIAGSVLDRLRRYDDCALAYQAAFQLDPEHAAAANALGLAYMRDGREEEAREWLDRGFKLDSFNIRTHNMRLLLDKLASYQRLESAHFVIKFDPADQAFIPLLAPYLEQVYADICPRFGFAPDRKTTIEVFAERDLLSARLVGLPGIEGIPGACFGAVIALDSPRLWEGSINWQTVLRHEFGHVLALTRTQKRVPFWFTEGLSVVLEEKPPTLASDRMARFALRENQLIPFNELNHGFTRPKSPLHRSLAYYQSAFAVRRMIDRRGFDTVLGVLDEYAAGKTTAVAFEERLGMSEAQWAADVDQAIRAHVESLPVWALGSRERLIERATESAANKADLGLRTRMAEEWFQAGEIETAVSEALAVLEADSSQVDARILLGHALLAEGQPLAAAEYLAPLVDREPVAYLVVRDLGLIYAEQGEDEAATSYLERAIQIYPTDPEPYRKLADVHRRAGRTREAMAVLERAAQVADDPFADLIALADLAQANRLPEAEAEALEESLALRPFAVDSVKRLAPLERQAGRAEQAVRAYEVLCLLEPDNVSAHEALVQLALEHGPRDLARRYAVRLKELDPASDVARRALEL
jgi:tetratricopeptide (TPR) repeat protein